MPGGFGSCYRSAIPPGRAPQLVPDHVALMKSAQRILIVEDDPSIAQVLQDNLAFEGFTVESVRDGRDVLAKVGDFLPHLILLDLTLAG